LSINTSVDFITAMTLPDFSDLIARELYGPSPFTPV